MAGNPFRRPVSTTAAAGGNLQQRDGTPPPNKDTPAKKRVTIQTPPHSPEDIPRRLSTGTTSPPPPRSPDDYQDDTDSTGTADSELEEAVRNTQRNSGPLPPPSGAAPSGVKAPWNPFTRTLATQEATYGIKQQDEIQGETGHQIEKGEVKGTNGTAGLDVDEFKNILLTGSAPPSQAVSAWSRRSQDNGSVTDASSTSRHSLFDPTLETHSETPGTSFDRMELLESPSESSDDEDDSVLVNHTASSRLPTRGDVSKGPQIVSFDDFRDDSFSKAVRGATSSTSVSKDIDGEERLSNRYSRDINNGIPPQQTRNTPSNNRTSSTSENNTAASQQPNPTIVTPLILTEQKKAPPPPPAARRTIPERRRRDSEESTLPTKPIEAPTKSAAPPPPPARKTRPISQTGPASSNTPSETPSPAPIVTDTKTMRPPPPPRSATRPESISNREALTTTRPSLPRNETSPASQNAPPAPPPRRSAANNSARNSIDGWSPNINGLRRSSEYSSNTERSASLPGLQGVDESVETGRGVPAVGGGRRESERDIMADMSAFQAEIDAMRARAGAG